MKLNDIKEKLNSVVFMSIGVGLAIISLLLMFAPAIDAGGDIYSSANIFFDIEGGGSASKGSWPVFLGYMLILAGGLIMGIIAFPTLRINIKVEKTLLITAAVITLIGSITIMCIRPIFIAVNHLNTGFMVSSFAGPYIAGVFGLLSSACAGIAIAYDWE